MADRKMLTAHVLALMCMIVWGTTFVVSKDLMHFLTPIQLVCIRLFIAYLVLWLIHPKWFFDRHYEWILLIAGFLSNTVYFIAENTALTLTYASNVSILTSTTSMMSLALMWITKKENVNRKQVYGLIAAFIGAVLVVLNGSVILGLNPAGDVLALTAALSWALYGLFLLKIVGKVDDFVLTRKLMFYGLITTLPLALAEGRPIDIDSLLSVKSILEVAFLAVLGSCACFVIWNHSIKTLGVVNSNAYLYIMPVITMIAGAIAFDENITLMAIIGTILIIGGLMINNFSRTKNKKDDELDESHQS